MGNSASKVIKKVPLKTPIESILPTARSTRPTTPTTTSTTTPNSKDGEDTNYLANLNALGAVKVPQQPSFFKPDARMLDILKSRQRAAEEEEALTTQPKSLNPTLRAHRISAQALSNLLDERKSAKTKDELKELCKMYGVDYEIVDELSTSVMAPSVSSIKSAKDEEEETQLARWIDPPISTRQQQIDSK